MEKGSMHTAAVAAAALTKLEKAKTKTRQMNEEANFQRRVNRSINGTLKRKKAQGPRNSARFKELGHVVNSSEAKCIDRFAHEETAHSTSYRFQGDDGFYSETMVTARKAVRTDNEVQRECVNFCEAYEDIGDDLSGGVTREEGVFVLKLCMKALYDPDEFDLEEATAVANEDWAMDVKEKRFDPDHCTLSFLKDMIFEVADQWCTGITATEYAEFLRKLHRRITADHWNEARQAWTRAWGRVDAVEAFYEDGCGAGVETRKRMKVAWQFETMENTDHWDIYESAHRANWVAPVELARQQGKAFASVVGRCGRDKVIYLLF
jgi:hypothetical protein